MRQESFHNYYQPFLSDLEAQSIRDDHAKLQAWRESWAERCYDVSERAEFEAELRDATSRSSVVAWGVTSALLAILFLCAAMLIGAQ